MTEKEYFLIFEVIIYAGIITQFLLGWSKMIKERGHFKIYWLHLLVSINVFLAVVQQYYAFKSLDSFEQITNTFTFLLIGILPLACSFVITFLLFPKTNINFDFKKYMATEFRVPYAIFTMLPLGNSTFRNIQKVMSLDTIGPQEYMLFAPHLIFVILFLILIFNKSLRYFSFIGIASFALISYFVVMH